MSEKMSKSAAAMFAAAACLFGAAGCSSTEKTEGSPGAMGEKKACCSGEAKDCCANNPGKACEGEKKAEPAKQ